jgi:hypothetical protein
MEVSLGIDISLCHALIASRTAGRAKGLAGRDKPSAAGGTWEQAEFCTT